MDFVDAAVIAFQGVDGFEPYTFVVWWAQPGAYELHDQLVCSLRFESWACIAHVEAHGPPRSAWHRGTTAGLLHAGYEVWHRFDDETSFRRALPSARARSKELAFLEALVEHGEHTRWPKRKPIRYRERAGTRIQWPVVLATARASAIRWTDACIGYKRRAPLVFANQLTGFDVNVSVLAMFDERTFRVSVAVFDPENPRAPLPALLRRQLRRELASTGYHFPSVKRGNERVRDHLDAVREEKTAADAAAECVKIFDRMTTL